MKLVWALAFTALAMVGCSHSSVQEKSPERDPAQASGIAQASTTVVASEKFVAEEQVPRQHTFLFADPKGHFGYHVSAFESNHQHQLIVKGHLAPVSKRSREAVRLQKLEKTIATPGKSGYYSVTSDQPRFLLSEIISGKRKEFLGNVFDGLIITKPNRVVETEANYVIEEKLYESPMHAHESHIADSVYIVYGSYGKAKKVYYLAHLIKGANNFEQILVAEFDKDLVIPNGALMVLNIPDTQPLKANEKQVGQISEIGDVNFTVKRQVYFEKKTAEGFTN